MKKSFLILCFGIATLSQAQTQFGDGSMLYLGNHSEVSDRKGGFYLYDSFEVRYHSSGQELFDKQFRYDTAKKIWTMYNYDYSVFNDKGLKVMYVDSAFEAGAIPNQIKETYLYNQDKQQIQLVRFKWDVSTGSWQFDYRHQSTYNPDGQLVERVFHTFRKSNSSWVNSSKSMYVYNTSNQIVEQVAYTWDSLSSAWTNKTRYKNTYNSYGLIATGLTEVWKNGKWENSSKREYQYNSDSLLTYDTYFNWNLSKSAWEAAWRNSNVYDASGGKEMAISEVFNTTKGVWENKSYVQMVLKSNDWTEYWTTYTWDDVAAKWKTGSKWVPYYMSNGYEYKRTSESWSTSANEFLPGSNYYYSYAPKSSLNVRNPERYNVQLQVYPNPTSGSVQLTGFVFDATDIFMTDLRGRRYRMNNFVSDQGGNLVVNIKDAGFTAGVYYLEVSSLQKTGIAKVLVQP